MFSVCVTKHLLEFGVIVIHILEEPLLGELLLGQGLCEGLDIGLREVVVLGLITCVEVGLVSRVDLLSSEVRSVTTASRLWKKCKRLKENEKRKLDGLESPKSKSDAHFMYGPEICAQVKP